VDPKPYLFDLSGEYSSLSVLSTLAALGGLTYLLFHFRVLNWAIERFSQAMRWAIRVGFNAWEGCLSWADWHVFLLVTVGLIALGTASVTFAPPIALAIAMIVLFMGVATCLAFMSIDLERYEVERGYKAVHNPLRGQEPAPRLAKYGSQVNVLLLLASTVAMLGGFALLNQGLYESFGAGWYKVHESGVAFDDFLTYTLLNLLRVIDVLDLADSRQMLRLSFVRPVQWPATVLIAVFRSFFTLVLLQQIFASLRQGRLLAETISDFWSPHEPIQQRAQTALPQYGAAAIGPLLMSLRSIVGLTKEQRDVLPQILAAIGPSTVPTLVNYLTDPNEHVRAVSASALGHLNACPALPALVITAEDSSEYVRQSLAEGLGHMAEEADRASRATRARGESLPTPRRWFRPAQRSLPFDPAKLIIATLRTLLGDTHAAVRSQAAIAIGRAGDLAGPAIPDLVMRLRDTDETVRCQAAAALGQTGQGGDEGMQALVVTLEDPSADVRSAAARALGELGKDANAAVSELVTLLQDRDEEVRAVAAEALTKVGPIDQESAATLVGGLASPDNVIRAQTAEALGSIGAPMEDAAEALTDSLRDSNDVVRAKAAEALGKIGEGAADVAIPGLVKALRDRDSWVSALAAEALGEMGEAADSAVPALVKALTHVNAQVRGNAAASLGKQGAGAERGRLPLERAAADEDGGVRAQAVRALGLLGRSTPGTLQIVLKAIDDLDPEVRVASVEALIEADLPGAELERVLLPLLADSNDEVKVQAAKTLARKIGAEPAVIEGLCQILASDDSSWVQVNAALALARMGSEAASAGPALLRAAQTGDVSVREQAMKTLAIIQPAEAREAFTVGLKDASAEVRLIASAGWMKAESVPPEAVQALVESLKDPEAQVRANAAYAMSRLEKLPANAIPLLLVCAADPNESLRINTTLALRKAPLGATSEIMMHLLEDPNGRVRLLAAGAILDSDLDHTAALSVAEAARSDPSPRVRQAAVELLDSITEARQSDATHIDATDAE